jgi:hypothetical protein
MFLGSAPSILTKSLSFVFLGNPNYLSDISADRASGAGDFSVATGGVVPIIGNTSSGNSAAAAH